MPKTRSAAQILAAAERGELVTVAAVAEAVGVQARTVRYAIGQGHLAGVEKVGDGNRATYYLPAEYLDPATYKAAVGAPGRKPRPRPE